jgi:hypothetical protein
MLTLPSSGNNHFEREVTTGNAQLLRIESDPGGNDYFQADRAEFTMRGILRSCRIPSAQSPDLRLDQSIQNGKYSVGKPF